MSQRAIASTFVLALGIVACAGSLPPAAQLPAATPQPTAAAPEKSPPFERDTQQATAHSTATFTVPKGWSIIREPDITRIIAPEGDQPILIADLAESAETALAATWKLRGREPEWKIANTSDIPARDGWHGGRVTTYDTPPASKQALQAIALGADNRSIVLVIDTPSALFETRLSQLSLITDSLHPSGYQQESFAGRTANNLDAARLAKLDELVAQAQREAEIPGVAVAIVQGGKLVQLRGYGVRELGKPAPVDPDTLFMVASTTKALTTLLLAQLVDEGKLRRTMTRVFQL